MIVVDLGCANIGTETSVEKLIERFQPNLLFGFDPNEHGGIYRTRDTTMILAPVAAWTHDGFCAYERRGTRSRVLSPFDPHPPTTEHVECFDLAAWLNAFPKNVEIVLKLDVEGAEYTLLPDLYERLRNRWPRLLLIEWHGEPLDTPYHWELWE